MVEKIFIIVLSVFAYFLLAMGAWYGLLTDFMDEEFDNYNPLIKIPLFLLYPLSVIGALIYLLFKEGIIPYCKEVRDYYKNKKGDKNA